MQLILNIENTENIQDMTQADKEQMKVIVEALIVSGGLTGVKGGKTVIHFDHNGIFQKVQLDYFPWVRRSLDKYQ